MSIGSETRAGTAPGALASEASGQRGHSIGASAGHSPEAGSSALAALIAAIRRSPIVALVAARIPLLAADWARIRKSPEVDAYVLAWIASHARTRRASRTLM